MSKKKRNNHCKALEKLKSSLGIFDFNTSSSDSMLTPAQWIKENLIGEIAEGKKEKIVHTSSFLKNSYPYGGSVCISQHER